MTATTIASMSAAKNRRMQSSCTGRVSTCRLMAAGMTAPSQAHRQPPARLHEELALRIRRRTEQDVGDPFGGQIEVGVRRVAVGRALLSVLELVAALRVGLEQPDDGMRADEAEPAVANLHSGQEVSQVL